MERKGKKEKRYMTIKTINYKIKEKEEVSSLDNYKKEFKEQSEEVKLLSHLMDIDLTLVCKMIEFVNNHNLIQDEIIEEMSDGFYVEKKDAYKSMLISLYHANYLSRWKLEKDCEVEITEEHETTH